MAALSRVKKLFIVERLACMDSPSEVAKAFLEEFGEKIDRRQVWCYDAARVDRRDRMSADLISVFDRTRKAFLDDIGAIPIANKAYRLRDLQKLRDKALAQGALALVAQFGEQAAKESGGAYTNKQEVTHSGEIRVESLSDQERAERIAALLDAARTRRTGPAVDEPPKEVA